MPDTRPETFPQQLRRIRREKGMTQRQLAEAAGICKQQVSALECGTGQPSLWVIRRLGEALGVRWDLTLEE